MKHPECGATRGEQVIVIIKLEAVLSCGPLVNRGFCEGRGTPFAPWFTNRGDVMINENQSSICSRIASLCTSRGSDPSSQTLKKKKKPRSRVLGTRVGPLRESWFFQLGLKPRRNEETNQTYCCCLVRKTAFIIWAGGVNKTIHFLYLLLFATSQRGGAYLQQERGGGHLNSPFSPSEKVVSAVSKWEFLVA